MKGEIIAREHSRQNAWNEENTTSNKTWLEGLKDGVRKRGVRCRAAWRDQCLMYTYSLLVTCIARYFFPLTHFFIFLRTARLLTLVSMQSIFYNSVLHFTFQYSAILSFKLKLSTFLSTSYLIIYILSLVAQISSPIFLRVVYQFRYPVASHTHNLIQFNHECLS